MFTSPVCSKITFVKLWTGRCRCCDRWKARQFACRACKAGLLISNRHLKQQTKQKVRRGQKYSYHAPYAVFLFSLKSKHALTRTFAQKTSTTQIFFILGYSQIMSYLCQKMQKNWGVTEFVFEINHVENYPNFATSVLVTLTWPQYLLVEKYLKWFPVEPLS